MKYAVYVEGKAELLFVADVLAKYSNYDPMVVGYNTATELNRKRTDIILIKYLI